MDYTKLHYTIKQETARQLETRFSDLRLRSLVDFNFPKILQDRAELWDLQFYRIGQLALNYSTSVEEAGLKPDLIDQISCLVVYTCGAASEFPEKAVPAAVAMNFIFRAAGLFDDIQDQDKASSLNAREGVGQALDIALTLLLLGQELLNNAVRFENSSLYKDGSSPSPSLLALPNRLYRELVIGLRGQFLDLQELQGELRSSLESPDYYLAKTGLKSATMFSYLTELGAALGYNNLDHEFIARYRQFGFYFGMVVQLLADLGDFLSAGKSPSGGRDLNKRLPSLPVIYGYNALSSESSKKLLLELWQKNPVPSEEIAALIGSTTAVSQTLGLVAQYINQAEDCLRAIDPTQEKLEHQIMLKMLKDLARRLQGYFMKVAE